MDTLFGLVRPKEVALIVWSFALAEDEAGQTLALVLWALARSDVGFAEAIDSIHTLAPEDPKCRAALEGAAREACRRGELAPLEWLERSGALNLRAVGRGAARQWATEACVRGHPSVARWLLGLWPENAALAAELRASPWAAELFGAVRPPTRTQRRRAQRERAARRRAAGRKNRAPPQNSGASEASSSRNSANGTITRPAKSSRRARAQASLGCPRSPSPAGEQETSANASLSR
jgi:hypothetical protein